MDEPFDMSHDDGFCGCNAGPEQAGLSQREEETIPGFIALPHCAANQRDVGSTKGK